MKIVGVDAGERELRIARAERRFGAVRLTGFERVPLEGPVEAGGAAVASALPAAAVAHRVLVLPFRDRRRLARTVPLELLGQLPVERDGLVVGWTALGPAERGTAVLAAAARKAEVDAHVATLAARGLPPARVGLAPLAPWPLVPPALGDAALVLADGRRSALAVRRGGRPAALRALAADGRDAAGLAAEVRWSLAALGGPPPVCVTAGADAGPALEAALAGVGAERVVALEAVAVGAPAASADLGACAVAAGLALGGGGDLVLWAAPAAGGGALRRAGGLAAAAILLAVVDLALVRHGLARRDAALAAAIRAEAAAALPGARLVAPRAQLEAAVAAATRRRGAASGALDVLRELSTRVPPSLRLDLDELVVDGDALRLHGRTDGFDAVDALRRALAASPTLADVTADEARTTVDGRHVEFRLHATRRPAGGTAS
ncbi:MAG TPA: PilN domain-containing protein [Candidatus Binatia bacterium]|nr:PilN domain-containing protein [Candidatus Binatia bacterium]